MTYRQMGPMGARIGAFFLDQIFLTLILCASIPYGLFPLLAVMGNLLYFGFFEGSGLHASLGKRLCGLIVVDRDGVPLDFGRAFLRALCRILSGTILGIGFLIGLLDREGKALHDQMAGTFVALRSTPGHTGTPQFHRPQPEKGEETVLHPQIIGISGQFAGQAFPVSTHGVMLGRDPSSCDFVFPAQCPGDQPEPLQAPVQPTDPDVRALRSGLLLRDLSGQRHPGAPGPARRPARRR